MCPWVSTLEKSTVKNVTRGCDSVIEHVPTTCKALDSIHSTAKKKEEVEGITESKKKEGTIE
jgi:hypothetical protein